MGPSRLASVLLCLLPCACGGEEDPRAGIPARQGDRPPTGYARFDPLAAAAHGRSAEFNRVHPGPAADSLVRRQLGAPPRCAGIDNPRCEKGDAYAVQHIEAAHTATLADGSRVTGAGVTIAIVDNGFRLSHEDLSGKAIRRFLGTAVAIGVDDHGTAVAAIAAAPADGRGIVGVAPDAALHLASWEDIGSGSLLPHLAAATGDAAARGAAVQNNSWSFADERPAGEEARAFARSGLADYAAFRALHEGGSAAEWRALFSAYDDFQKTGVIVFSNTNDADLGDASAWAALPEFVPELGEAWITVSNALFAIDGDSGAILKADLLSAPCGTAARFCLTADGTLIAPAADSDAARALGTGTSYAAPQVAGGIALLAQAFPGLGPAERTARLLATARRDWPGFQSTISGQTTFAPGVRRTHSRLFGHGVPDIRAALSPLGGLSIATGANVHDGPRTALAGGVVLSAPVIGNAVTRALAGRHLMAVDALGTGFRVSGRRIAAGPVPRPGGLPAVAARRLRALDRLAAGFAFAEAPGVAAVGLRDTAAAKLYFALGFSEAGAQHAFARLTKLAPETYLQIAGALDADRADLTLAHLAYRGRISSEFSLSAGHGFGSLFGQKAEEPFMTAQASGYVSAALTLAGPIGAGWSLAGFAELGAGYVDATPGALLDIGALAYGDAGLVLGKTALLTGDDTLRLYAGTRPTPVAGRAELRLPVGRDARGTIGYETIGIDLARADLPWRLGFSYAVSLPSGIDLQAGANMDFTQREPGSGRFDLAVRLSRSF